MLQSHIPKQRPLDDGAPACPVPSQQVQGLDMGTPGAKGCEPSDSPAVGAHARVHTRGTDGGGGLLSQATSISKAAAAAVVDVASTALAPLQRTFNRNSYSAGPHLASEISKLAAAAAAAEDAARVATQVPAPVVDEVGDLVMSEWLMKCVICCTCV
jgi:hypothetical protein